MGGWVDGWVDGCMRGCVAIRTVVLPLSLFPADIAAAPVLHMTN